VVYGVHVAFAILFLVGIAAAAVFNVRALAAPRPSAVVREFRRVRPIAMIVSLALLGALATGLVLVHRRGYAYGDGWILASIVLWVLANALGGIGGGRDRRTRELAERLAAEGDAPSDDLRRRVRDPVSLALSYGAGLAGIAIFVLMLTKP
jgi:uncharacterized membrane protein